MTAHWDVSNVRHGTLHTRPLETNVSTDPRMSSSTGPAGSREELPSSIFRHVPK